MLNGLSLFSGIGGLDVALSEWVRPIAYCEIDPYCQGVLLNGMFNGLLPVAPIWDDVVSLRSQALVGITDILYGGFPCQDISVAGHGKGLEGERSGLFFELLRISNEIKPRWIFLENVPAITTRGGLEVVRQIAKMGYDCRWITITAVSVGALHRRERWFMLAHSNSESERGLPIGKTKEKSSSSKLCENVSSESMADTESKRLQIRRGDIRNEERIERFECCSENVSNARCQPTRSAQESEWAYDQSTGRYRFWEIEPSVGRVADGIPNRVDRIRGLGNAVVPQQAKEAFKILMGIK